MGQVPIPFVFVKSINHKLPFLIFSYTYQIDFWRTQGRRYFVSLKCRSALGLLTKK